jgi:hypothetical protein
VQVGLIKSALYEVKKIVIIIAKDTSRGNELVEMGPRTWMIQLSQSSFLIVTLYLLNDRSHYWYFEHLSFSNGWII